MGKPEVAVVRLLGPSVVARGEAFSVTVRSEDDAMNRASGPAPAYEVTLDGKVVGRVAAGATRSRASTTCASTSSASIGSK